MDGGLSKYNKIDSSNIVWIRFCAKDSIYKTCSNVGHTTAVRNIKYVVIDLIFKFNSSISLLSSECSACTFITRLNHRHKYVNIQTIHNAWYLVLVLKDFMKL